MTTCRRPRSVWWCTSPSGSTSAVKPVGAACAHPSPGLDRPEAGGADLERRHLGRRVRRRVGRGQEHLAAGGHRRSGPAGEEDLVRDDDAERSGIGVEEPGLVADGRVAWAPRSRRPPDRSTSGTGSTRRTAPAGSSCTRRRAPRRARSPPRSCGSGRRRGPRPRPPRAVVSSRSAKAESSSASSVSANGSSTSMTSSGHSTTSTPSGTCSLAARWASKTSSAAESTARVPRSPPPCTRLIVRVGPADGGPTASPTLVTTTANAIERAPARGRRPASEPSPIPAPATTAVTSSGPPSRATWRGGPADLGLGEGGHRHAPEGPGAPERLEQHERGAQAEGQPPPGRGEGGGRAHERRHHEGGQDEARAGRTRSSTRSRGRSSRPPAATPTRKRARPSSPVSSQVRRPTPSTARGHQPNGGRLAVTIRPARNPPPTRARMGGHGTCPLRGAPAVGSRASTGQAASSRWTT